MNDLQTDRWDRLMRRLFAMSQGVIAPTVAPEILPVFVIEPPNRPENEYLRLNRLYHTYDSQAAPGAGNYLTWAYLNNSTDRIAVITRITMGVAGNYGIGNALVGALAGARNWSRDTRYLGPVVSKPALDTYLGSTAVLSQIEGRTYATIPVDVELVLAPGGILRVEQSTANTTGYCLIEWRERYIEIPERT